jgi:hypothetical protein
MRGLPPFTLPTQVMRAAIYNDRVAIEFVILSPLLVPAPLKSKVGFYVLKKSVEGDH